MAEDALSRPRAALPSDMTDAEWAVVRPLLPVPGAFAVVGRV